MYFYAPVFSFSSFADLEGEARSKACLEPWELEERTRGRSESGMILLVAPCGRSAVFLRLEIASKEEDELVA
jgi:hypothetical protein